MGKNGVYSKPVLVLNATFEPLNVCNIKRALGLVLSGKAEIIVNGRGYIHTSTADYELPSVIRLSSMVKRPHPRIALSKREILHRDNYTCQYCGKRTRVMTIDHVIPRRLNGPYTWENLVAACPSCNHHKGSKTPEEANMMLKRKPFEPTASAQYRFGHHLNSHQEWQQFIEGW
ncbi:MAG: HNH endonuclease [Ardenticatenaceae bacterium]|nr:HNH endonuclease [Ardenticatenaceae bacterium]